MAIEENEFYLSSNEADNDELGRNNIYKLYFKDMGAFSCLSNDEEVELGKRITNGDLNARQQLIEKNLKLVVSIAKTFQTSEMELIDLIQEGNIGLIKAADTFDVTKGYKFSTYATSVITRSIIAAIKEKSKSIRLPGHIYKIISSYKEIESKLQNKLNRVPSIEEIAKAMKIDVKEASFLYSLQLDYASLNNKVDDEHGDELIDFVAGEDCVEDMVISKMMKFDFVGIDFSSVVKPQEFEILKMHYGIGYDRAYTLEEIGKILRISKEGVRQKEAKALRKIRKLVRGKSIHDYDYDSDKVFQKVLDKKVII